MPLEGVSDRHCAMCTWFSLFSTFPRTGPHRRTPRTRWTVWFCFCPPFGHVVVFTLLLCAMLASFAAISDRVILAELEGILVLSFSDLLWVSGFLSHLLSVRRFGCDGGSDSLFFVSSSLFPLLFLCLFFFVWPFHTALANARP